MDALRFTIPGPPVPQPRPRFAVVCGRPKAYKVTRHRIHAYREAVALAARGAAVARRHQVTSEPVVLEILFVFQRPPSHLTKTGLSSTAKAYPPRCDWDNLGKGVSDAITQSGAVWVDDDQAVDVRVVKRYAERGEPARTEVVVRSPEHGEA